MLLCDAMPDPVIISKATISMEEGSILKWFKTEGEAVGKDEVLFEMETDKAVVEVGAPVAGVLLRILAAEGAVKVGSVVGWIGQPGESIEEIAGPPQPMTESARAPTALPEAELRPARISASPAARRRAAELGVALESVQSSTPGGRIDREDVERAAAQRGDANEKRLCDRKTLIRRLMTSWQSVPHIHIARRLDAKGLMEAKERLTVPDISVTDLLLHALVLLLPQFPELSMIWRGDKLVLALQTNLAFAVDTDRGVVAPVISAANDLSLEERSKRRRELTKAARAHHLRPEETEGGVFTLTNLGMQGVDFFAPVINAPQTATLAMGKIRQEPVITDGVIGIGWRMWANLAVDHRVADGTAAAQISGEVADRSWTTLEDIGREPMSTRIVEVTQSRWQETWTRHLRRDLLDYIPLHFGDSRSTRKRCLRRNIRWRRRALSERHHGDHQWRLSGVAHWGRTFSMSIGVGTRCSNSSRQV